MTTNNPHPDPLGRLIYYTAQGIHNMAEKLLQPFGITLEQFQTLKVLTMHDGQTQCHLCRETNKTAANMTRLLDRLEKKGLLLRQAKPDDRRATKVVATDKGRDLVSELRSHLEFFSASMTTGLSANDQQTVRSALQTICINLKAMAEELEQSSSIGGSVSINGLNKVQHRKKEANE